MAYATTPTAERPAKVLAAAASLGLSVLFLVIYNTTNWVTSLRSDVGTWYYAWERFIPFVPAMIVPYMSIDLFFVVAPFLCADRRELRIFSQRIALSMVLAGACFLAFPLTLAVERPRAAGWLGAAFGMFQQADLPYNLCPSLHIALRTILADLYARHTRGAFRWSSHAWFSLIGLSTLLTYQHHVVDVAGGFVLAAVCFYAVRAAPWQLPVVPNVRVGRLYALAAVLLAAAATALRSWGWLLLWPAVASGVVAGGYFGLGPAVFAKHAGRLPLSARFVLAPVLAGQYLSLLYYRRQCRAWDRVTDQLWIGRRLSDAEAAQAIQEGVTSVVDLTVAFSEPGRLRAIPHLHLPVLDLTAPTMEQLDEAVAFIDEQSSRGIVYVHCKIGYSRSAAVVGAYLLATGHAATSAEAIERMRSVRPAMIVRPEVQTALQQFERRLHHNDKSI